MTSTKLLAVPESGVPFPALGPYMALAWGHVYNKILAVPDSGLTFWECSLPLALM
jgi:hypothetical protein